MRDILDINPIRWIAGEVALIDQTKLPLDLVTVRIKTFQAMAEAIETMLVRGAPAIGIAAAFGVVLAAQEFQNAPTIEPVEKAIARLRQTRPTAVNLFLALDRMHHVLHQVWTHPSAQRIERLLAEAQAILNEDIAMCHRIGEHGASLISNGMGILTHCNAGALATGGWGTALGVIRSAYASGKNFMVYADETRPRQQGSRLTAWELQHSQIPVTLIADTVAGSLMQAGKIQLVVIGADRIARNGDVANKIGSYSLAVLARHHGIPFLVAAPSSTIDAECTSGQEIPIEYRSDLEVTHIGVEQIAPSHISVLNPAFDVTPAALVSAIVSEQGVFTAPYHF